MVTLLAGGLDEPTGGSAASVGEVPDVPSEYLRLYRAAAQSRGLDWAILAAIGKIETNHGRSTLPGVRAGVNTHGCCAGPMQFFVNRAMTGGRATTWDLYGVDGNGDGVANPYDPADAIPTAADYLRASGAPADYRRAIYAYNRAWWYVADVLAQAGTYRREASTPVPTSSVGRTGVFAPVPLEVAARPGLLLDSGVLPMALQIARTFGVRITSGYRDPVSNLRGGGAPRSDHLCGLAADFGGSVPAMVRVEQWARTQGYAWVDGPWKNVDGGHGDHVHVSFGRCS